METSHDSEEEIVVLAETPMNEERATGRGSSEKAHQSSLARKRKHPVWDFFAYEDGESRCQLCSYKVDGAYPATLTYHFATRHAMEHDCVMERKKGGKKKEKQQKINFPVIDKYRMSNAEKEKIDESLALFAGSTSFAYHLVENEYFINFVSALNPRYELPCRETLKKSVAEIVEHIKVNNFVKRELQCSVRGVAGVFLHMFCI
uniref:BED-type domain-containing protein n=1 Tax=Plectus sambesii TaxID=2011161 RepID=A0A914W8Z5_9BILA